MIEIRPITDAEVPQFRRAVAAGFGLDEPDDDAEAHDQFRMCCDLATTLAAFDRDHIVATFASFDLALSVPGGSVSMAGTTVVTVSPTHRRRGILTEMMTRHLRQAIDRAQPLAGLWASEDVIYGRFGYGPAARGLRLDLSTESVTVAPSPADVTIRPLSVDEARRALPPIHSRWAATVPGCFQRSEAWWEWRHFSDRPSSRAAGATSRRTVLAERADRPVGYAVYRQRSEWGSVGSVGHVDIVEFVFDDDDARRALWHYLTNIDLFPNVHWWNAPVDEPVLVEIDRFRSIQNRSIDTLWLRLLDVPACLAARRYEADGTIVLDVTDPFLGCGGSFLVEVVDGIAECEEVSAGPGSRAALDIADLSALYLGGRSASTLARAGRIEADDASIRSLDQVFRTQAAPYCGEVF